MPGTNTSEAPVDAIPVKRKNRLRMCLYTSLSFLVVSVGMFIVLGLTRHAHDLGYKGPKNTFEGPSVRLAVGCPVCALTICRWSLNWCLSLRTQKRERSHWIGGSSAKLIRRARTQLCSRAGTLTSFSTSKRYHSGMFCLCVSCRSNLLRTNVAGNGGEVLTSDRPTQPIFRFNATTFAQRDELANTPAFRTVLALFSSFTSKSSLLYYPFDR